MCFKQAGLMQDLRARLINGGFFQVEFRILSAESPGNGTDGFWRLRHAAGHPTIPVLQEAPSNILWHNVLDGAMDHILVLDRCSRLTYQVITPWSILHFPYVKAAILSTYEDDPCGTCEEAKTLDRNSSGGEDWTTNSALDLNENASNNSAEMVDMPSSAEFPSMEQTQSSDSVDITVAATLAPLTEQTDGTVPIRVVMHAPHQHRHVNGTVTQHEYLELQTGNPDYHGHLVNDNNLVFTNSTEEQTPKRKKYKGHRRKGKLRPESTQTETQESNYEDTKLKHHRDKERPEKKKQKIKSEEQNASEEVTVTTSATTAATTTIPMTPPLEIRTTPQPILIHTVEVDTEAASLEIPQDIQEHYDYRNMPYFSNKHLHKPETVTEVTATESTSNTEEQEEETVIRHPAPIISKTMTSDKQIIKGTEKVKDHKKWKPSPPQRENVENEQDMVNASIISNSNETSNSEQQSHDTIVFPEDDTDLNLIESEEHKMYKPNKSGKEMQETGNLENQPTNGLSNEDEDENKKQVIQHYSQLLKWIHYSLPENRD